MHMPRIRNTSLLLAVVSTGFLYLAGCGKETSPAEKVQFQQQEMQAQQQTIKMEEGSSSAQPSTGQSPTTGQR